MWHVTKLVVEHYCPMTTHDAQVLVLSDLVDPQEVVSLGKDSNFDGSRPENAMGTKFGAAYHIVFFLD